MLKNHGGERGTRTLDLGIMSAVALKENNDLTPSKRSETAAKRTRRRTNVAHAIPREEKQRLVPLWAAASRAGLTPAAVIDACKRITICHGGEIAPGEFYVVESTVDHLRRLAGAAVSP